MEVIQPPLQGLLLIKTNKFQDTRGYFSETFQQERYKSLGIKDAFVQDNISFSKQNVVRGLHYQKPPFAQGKLVYVLRGKVLDVVVDVRKKSLTFGKHFAVELSEANSMQLWIPEGFAHGFAVLSNEAIFAYKCTNYYDKNSEEGIRYNDPELAIDWGVSEPIVSEKDLQLPLFKQIDSPF